MTPPVFQILKNTLPVPNPGNLGGCCREGIRDKIFEGKREGKRGREGVTVRGRVRGKIMEKVILKICYFLTNICLYLRNDTTYTHCYIGAVIGTNIFIKPIGNTSLTVVDVKFLVWNLISQLSTAQDNAKIYRGSFTGLLTTVRLGLYFKFTFSFGKNISFCDECTV